MHKKTHFLPRDDAKTLPPPLPPVLHHLSPVILANATIVVFVMLRNIRFSLYCYTQREPVLTQKSARKWQLRLFWTSCAKGMHSSKPASLKCPISGTEEETVIALSSQLLFCLRKGNKICIRRTPLRGRKRRRRRIQRRVAPALTPTGREKNTVTSNVYLTINLETPCHVLIRDASFRTQQQESRKG